MREWIRVDTGLLDAEDWASLLDDEQAMWIRLYLMIARNGGRAKDRKTLEWWAVRASPGKSSEEVRNILERLGGWISGDDEQGWTIKGFDIYQRPLRNDPTGATRQAKRRAKIASGGRSFREIVNPPPGYLGLGINREPPK